MSSPVRFRPEAQAEATETRVWYEQRQPGLGEAFTTELASIVGRIAENPQQFRRVRGDVRRGVLNRFPYAVYFRMHQAEVVVLAVHGRQDPRRWRHASSRVAGMIPIESVLPIFEAIDGADLSPRTFATVCTTSGWEEPVNDGIGLWEASHATDGTMLVLDTVTKPTTLFCRLDARDDYEPEALRDGALRLTFDAHFVHSLERLRARFPRSLAQGTYGSPYNWRFAHFQGLNSLVALEQTYYDPIMGVQLVLLLQPLPSELPRLPITAAW